MKTAALALLTLTIVYSVESFTTFDRSLHSQWEHFKSVFQKSYPAHLENARKQTWLSNVKEIIHHNLEYDLGKHSFRKGINEYADMSHAEFVMVMNGYKQSNQNSTSSSFIPFSNGVLPDSVDWRDKGFVTPVKNQGQCGACWAFSTTGSLEGQHKKKTGKLVSLSEQNLIDCAGSKGSGGCFGGLLDLYQPFQYVIKNGGIDTEESYPYIGEAGPCRYNPSYSGATCTGYVDIPSGDESALQTAVATVGPVAVVIDASPDSFQLYSSGIYDEPVCSSEYLDHSMLVVGYGTEDGQDYWIVKNSWGTSWGENGYIRMSRNKSNQCGIATLAIYPLA